MEKIAIGYAKRAKKMNMRQLKAIEWELLTSRLLNRDINENDVASRDGIDQDKNHKSAEATVSTDDMHQNLTGSTTFSKLYKDLYSSKMMPPQVLNFLH